MKALKPALTVFLLTLTGCASQGPSTLDPTAVLVRAGTAEYIASDAETALKVIEWTEEVLGILDGNPEILVAKLHEIAQRTIPWDELSPGRRIVATETLLYVEASLTKGVTDGKLPPDATVRLRELIETAAWQAQFELALAQSP